MNGRGVDTVVEQLSRGMRWLLGAGVVGMAGVALVGVLGGDGEAEAASGAWGAGVGAGYLAAFLLWSALPLGMAALLMLHHLVGGRWGIGVQPLMAATLSGTLLLPVLFVPVALDLAALYPWAQPERVAESEVLQHQRAYLNAPAFLARAVLFFALWIGGGLLLAARSLRSAGGARAPLIAAPGALIYAFSVSFAGIDWIGSLEAEWYSSMFGLYIIIGQVATALAFAVLVSACLPEPAAAPKEPENGPKPLDDLGKLLLAVVVLHAYVGYSQFFIIWNGNLPHKISWYLPRTEGAWGAVAIGIVLMHFALPLAALLSHAARQRRRAMAAVACAVLLARPLDAAWAVLPSAPGGWIGVLAYLTGVVGIGGFMLAIVAWSLRRILQRGSRAGEEAGHE